MKKTGKRIPISDAKRIGKERGYSQVIIVTHDKNTGIESVCTWGENQQDCEMAAEGGNFVKKALGWPDKNCKSKPRRQTKKEKEINQVLVDLKNMLHNHSQNDAVNITRFVEISLRAEKLI